ncbi:MAG: SurA N-terminal domain-containing protein [Hydrotalea sp.]|nr:SurA N-terminal domain-containing protein [Hydrotalea sp.]
MLQFVRTLASNKPFQIILGLLLAVGFISFGASNFSPSGAPLVKMKGGNITQRQFQAYYQNQLTQTNLADLSTEQQKKLQLPQKILQQMILERLLLQAAQDMNLQLSDRVVARAIQQDPAFQDPATGKFSKDLYLSVIRQNGISEGVVIDQIKKNLLLTWLKNYFDGSHFDTPSLANLWQGDNGQVAFTYIAVDADNLARANGKPIPSPTDDDLQGFYNNHLALYQKPDYRRFQILTLSPQVIKNAAAKRAVVTDADLKNAYDAQSDNFIVPASYQFEQLLFADKKLADAFYAGHQNNTAPLSSQKATGAKYNNITLGDNDLTGYGFQPNDAIGKTSSVVETPFGFAIIRLVKKTNGGPKPLAEVASSLRAQILAQKINQAVNDIYRQVGDQLAAGKSFNAAMQAAGITGGAITTTAFMDKQGRNQAGSAIKNQPYMDNITSDGFTDGIKTAPLVLTDIKSKDDTGNDESVGLVAISLLDSQPPILPTFDKVKNIVAQDWQRDAAQTILLQEKQTIDAQINNGKFDFAAYQQAKKLPAANFSFSQKQMLSDKPIFQNLNNNDVLRLLFASVATGLSNTGVTRATTPQKLFVMKQLPRKVADGQKNSADFKKQFYAATAEGWLLNLYRTYKVTIDWPRVDSILN